jgi:pseudouridine-5'-phosphate glycosidase
MMIDKSLFHINSEVEDAITKNAPVLALESAVITHGLPRPMNWELARELESIARSQDVMPATIAFLHGQIQVGLDEGQLHTLAFEEGMRKISRRDLAIASSSRVSGGTTVAATLFAAHAAGIQVFATGGIGGVHRDAIFDMSADLPELARTPLIVVCSGAKAILDLPATRETLETMGIPVIGFRTDEFPAFYSPSSGLPVDYRAESVEEITEIFVAHRRLKLDSAILVVNPPPSEFAVPGDQLEHVIQDAVRESMELNIRGAALTPFLLRRVSELTGGESLQANLELLKQNVKIACQIAVCLAKIPRIQ